ncbi:hypothetical protein CONPUDRAFT_123556 [Coniophora puteana RWD-64-598 SS2]|uniref:Uncharacterized protein n=1 Tax=Coniophora puteana (strain RWD-64-598) TaxID=741705 RepID=A0A5M3MTN2_CONPW|nr:uncharacterized protein CONPUDRAFT_123556 [Coniophora puteana RWD-64-598 SS2]EIW82518.1 hypothetical protein CONPUDRAFT_123556 [Coniophora puteana RWD-64-598 SS2]
MSNVAKAIKRLLPSPLPPSLRTVPGNLFEVLSRYGGDGVGQRVHQTRWTSKGIEECYWQVEKTRIQEDGRHGKAWGTLYWKGKPVSEKPEIIRGGLKYKWERGPS